MLEGATGECGWYGPTATARLTLVSISRWRQVRTLARLLAAVTLDVGSAGLAHLTAVAALRNWATLLVDVLKRSICSVLVDLRLCQVY